jgi:hypothetical protein
MKTKNITRKKLKDDHTLLFDVGICVAKYLEAVSQSVYNARLVEHTRGATITFT